MRHLAAWLVGVPLSVIALWFASATPPAVSKAHGHR
jgi:hypothetical protein